MKISFYDFIASSLIEENEFDDIDGLMLTRKNADKKKDDGKEDLSKA